MLGWTPPDTCQPVKSDDAKHVPIGKAHFTRQNTLETLLRVASATDCHTKDMRLSQFIAITQPSRQDVPTSRSGRSERRLGRSAVRFQTHWTTVQRDGTCYPEAGTFNVFPAGRLSSLPVPMSDAHRVRNHIDRKRFSRSMSCFHSLNLQLNPRSVVGTSRHSSLVDSWIFFTTHYCLSPIWWLEEITQHGKCFWITPWGCVKARRSHSCLCRWVSVWISLWLDSGYPGEGPQLQLSFTGARKVADGSHKKRKKPSKTLEQPSSSTNTMSVPLWLQWTPFGCVMTYTLLMQKVPSSVAASSLFVLWEGHVDADVASLMLEWKWNT